jgi:Zn-dependent peptidase ImmA (M78 family)
MIAEINSEAEDIAKTISLAMIKLKPTISDLVAWVESNFNCRIRIDYTDFYDRPCSGLVYEDSKSSNEERPVYRIWINKNEYWKRQRFTLCHELGHIIHGQALIYGFFRGDIVTASGVERFCNRFAAAFLMPPKEFKKIWQFLDDELIIKMFKISNIFDVSLDGVRYRALELGLLNI